MPTNQVVNLFTFYCTFHQNRSVLWLLKYLIQPLLATYQTTQTWTMHKFHNKQFSTVFIEWTVMARLNPATFWLALPCFGFCIFLAAQRTLQPQGTIMKLPATMPRFELSYAWGTWIQWSSTTQHCYDLQQKCVNKMSTVLTANAWPTLWMKDWAWPLALCCLPSSGASVVWVETSLSLGQGQTWPHNGNRT